MYVVCHFEVSYFTETNNVGQPTSQTRMFPSPPAPPSVISCFYGVFRSSRSCSNSASLCDPRDGTTFLSDPSASDLLRSTKPVTKHVRGPTYIEPFPGLPRSGDRRVARYKKALQCCRLFGHVYNVVHGTHESIMCVARTASRI